MNLWEIPVIQPPKQLIARLHSSPLVNPIQYLTNWVTPLTGAIRPVVLILNDTAANPDSPRLSAYFQLFKEGSPPFPYGEDVDPP